VLPAEETRTSSLLAFGQVSIRARPVSATLVAPRTLAGRDVQPLVVPPSDVGQPLPVSFEDALSTLQSFARMFAEPDGAFVWTGDAPRWQLDGVLYDRHDHVLSIDLKGSCPQAEWELLLNVFGWPRVPLMLEWHSAGLFLSAEEFRRLAEMPPGL